MWLSCKSDSRNLRRDDALAFMDDARLIVFLMTKNRVSKKRAEILDANIVPRVRMYCMYEYLDSSA